MNSASSTPPKTVSPTDIVECVRAYLKAQGLERTWHDFEGLEHLLSRLPCWTEVKLASEELFAEERRRQEELVMARARAAATTILQVLPSAQAGVNNGIQFNDTVGQFIEHADNINKHNSGD